MEMRPEGTLVAGPTSPTASLPSDLEYCRRVTRQHSSSFYLASLLFPARQREAVWAIYAACREGDDIVDELPQHEARPRLEAWRDRILNALEGHGGSDPVSRALARARQAYPIAAHPFAEMHQGFLMDLEAAPYETMDDLLLYCRRVGGTVGCMVLPVTTTGAAKDEVIAAAVELGTAMQLTNVLRDVGEDLKRGRLYLPRDLLTRHGVRQQDLEAGLVTPGYVALLREISSRADDMYERSIPAVRSLDLSSRLAVVAAASFYREIGCQLARDGWNNLTERSRVSTARKLALLPGSFWRGWRNSTVVPDQA